MTEENKNFTHLHVHTSYSFLDGMCKIPELIKRAKELGMKAIAITDHNHIGGSYDFQTMCRKNDIKPILGLEAYYTESMKTLALPIEERNRLAAEKALATGKITQEEYDVYFKKAKNAKIKITAVKEKIKKCAYDTRQYHIIFLVLNQIGWKNLIKLQSDAAQFCTFNGRFLCDNELIRKYNEGLICTTACIANRIARYVNAFKENKAEFLLKEWINIFGKRLYLEIQPLNMLEQAKVNEFYLRMAQKYNLKLIATNDVHYVMETDHDDHDTLLCIGTGTKKRDVDRMKYTNDFWLRSYDEMMTAFKLQYENFFYMLPENYLEKVEEALANTNDIADLVSDDIKIGSDVPLIPQVKLSPGKTALETLTSRCWQELYKLAGRDSYVAEHLVDYEKRLQDEITVIGPKGFASYLLVVDESVAWANNNGVPTGPGRGSAAGSLCLYLLGVTKHVDPLKEDLLFSRFLTAERTSPPDYTTIVVLY